MAKKLIKIPEPTVVVVAAPPPAIVPVVPAEASPDVVRLAEAALAASAPTAAEAEQIAVAEAARDAYWADQAAKDAEVERRGAERRDAAAAAAAARAQADLDTPAPPAAPPCVEVLRAYRLQSSPWHNGQPWDARPGDVFSGERAAWLWAHARDRVVAFPPAE